MDYRCITDIKDLQGYIGDSRVIAFDLETSPTDKFRDDDKAAFDSYRAEITGISLSVKPETAVYVPFRHKTGNNADFDGVMDYLKNEVFLNKSCKKVAHNLSFESMFLYKHRIIIQPPVYDTIAAAQLTLKSNTLFRELKDSGLKTLVLELFDTEMLKFEEVTGGRYFDELNPMDEETLHYACADSDYTLRLHSLFNDWYDRFLPRHRFIVEEIKSSTAVYVGLMKYNGLLVDKDLMFTKQAEAADKLSRLKEDITFIIGDVDIGANASTSAFKSYLYNDLGLPVLKTTAKYQEAADDEALILLTDWCKENRPELASLFELIQEYRKWSKLKSTYIDGYLEHINTETRRIHPDLLQLGAESGRFSCRKPNLQNQSQSSSLPVNIRDFIVAPEGSVILEADYNQVELRIAAYLSQDKTILTAYANHEDIHAITTAAIFHMPLDTASDKHRDNYKKRRTVAKSTIFGVLYGIYKRGLQRNLKITAGIDLSVDECEMFIKNLKERYSTLAAWQCEIIRKASFRHYAETKLGRRRYVPNITSSDFMKRGNAERAALNHGVQGLAADILKLAMGRLVVKLSDYPWIKPVLTVHDSLVFYVPDERILEAATVIKECMETKPPLEDFKVPIITEIATGKSYGSMQEI